MSKNIFLFQKDDKVILNLNVKPNSKHQKLSYDPLEEELTIYIKSPPDKGKANKELIKYLADILNLSSSKITLIAGHASRDKTLVIEDSTVDSIMIKILQIK